MRNFSVVIITMCLLVSCSSYHIPESPKLSINKTWILMPFNNLSGAPLAAEQVEELIATVLEIEGIKLKMYQATEINAINNALDPGLRLKKAKEWALDQSATYIVTGSISEWRYKSGLDAEPSVGIILKVLNGKNNEVLWRATGARSGWGRENLALTGMKVLDELVDGLTLE